ncbi:MAG: porin [Steroidobacteraceae bacterium]
MRLAVAAVLGMAALASASAALADDAAPTVSVGAGMRTSFASSKPDGGNSSNDFDLNSIRLYVSGSVTNDIKFTFNTEYTGDVSGDNKVQVMDAIARFEFSDEFNIWAGRFLPPSDRANLHGPYYSNEWSTFIDGVQDGYASVAVGRDDGIAYWGQFLEDKLTASAGLFSIPSSFGSGHVVEAERLQLDLWDAEKGYYVNGTYYGDKDILALGVAGQELRSKSAYSVDFLMEKKLGDLGMVSVQGEYAKYEFGGYAADKSDGGYGLVSYLFPQVIGIGKFEVLAKYAKTTYDYGEDDDSEIVGSIGQKTKIFEIGYIIKEFNARVSLFYTM